MEQDHETVDRVPSRRVRVYGREFDADTYAVRDFLSRSVVQFDWVPLRDDDQAMTVTGVRLDDARLPIVTFPDGTRLVAPALRDIADRLGWIHAARRSEYDLSIYGAGPAGLSAAVYAASEGLNVVLLERDAVGGQAGSSSLIENYLGFPEGVPGAELAERAREQAIRFGAELLVMREGVRGVFHDNRIHADLADGGHVVARANICATGVAWRRLGLPREDELLGCGVYYGAGTGEADGCVGEQVFVVGGANSAGQAAMNLARSAAHVTMLVRGASLAATMSEYLSSRIAAAPNISVETGTRVTGLLGDTRLAAIEVTDGRDSASERPASRLFICIGGEPDTNWAAETPMVRDRLGYLVTGPDLDDVPGSLTQWAPTRRPFYLETSVPGSFAAGDVRAGSVKRVAAAVGEGAMAVTFVHRHLATSD
ncbi:NAD(P)/FAD-dependent oxidoreductase [Curtobacterium sp. PhB115]|uniref:NAD(P)/FAD-dependent oxidoreductase n=1 Tax=Curtobacterium sp. PhB115 TaxID=2485173 RepID=UPI000F4B8480|nr:NAD(P)/FAD-dependent oxidoreductase [Curtobacterium sp. PhB115]ROP65447.1 thioredoxin reductase (NADPH) [Curtobacterium sp. PhB115]